MPNLQWVQTALWERHQVRRLRRILEQWGAHPVPLPQRRYHPPQAQKTFFVSWQTLQRMSFKVSPSLQTSLLQHPLKGAHPVPLPQRCLHPLQP